MSQSSPVHTDSLRRGRPASVEEPAPKVPLSLGSRLRYDAQVMSSVVRTQREEAGSGLDRQRWLLDLTSISSLSLAFVNVLSNWSALPSRVPVHFDARGLPDRFGTKAVLLALPLAATVLLGAMWRARRLVHRDPLVRVTRENAARVYAASRTLLAAMAAVFALLFASVTVSALYVSLGLEPTLSWWLVPLFVASFAVALAASCFRVRRAGERAGETTAG